MRDILLEIARIAYVVLFLWILFRALLRVGGTGLGEGLPYE